jgi:hypothetical protein
MSLSRHGKLEGLGGRTITYFIGKVRFDARLLVTQ